MPSRGARPRPCPRASRVRGRGSLTPPAVEIGSASSPWAAARWQAAWRPLAFTAASVAILRRDGDAPFHVARVIPLAPGTLPRTSSGKIRRSEALQSFHRGDLVEPAPVSFPRLALEMLRSRRALRRASS